MTTSSNCTNLENLIKHWERKAEVAKGHSNALIAAGASHNVPRQDLYLINRFLEDLKELKNEEK